MDAWNWQSSEGWGTKVIPRLSRDLHNDFPEIKGFSERNLNRMVAFFREYPTLGLILPQPVAKLNKVQKTNAAAIVPQPVAKLGDAPNVELARLSLEIPWGHN